MVVGVTDGYEKKLEIVGTGYRVVGQGLGPRVRARLQPPDHGRRRPRASPSPSRRPPGSRCRASTSSRSARSPPTSASCASPTRTRARACGTRASRSAARSERLGSKPWQSRSSGPRASVAARGRRHLRVRKKVTGTPSRPRLVVTRSARHVFVQVVDDIAGHDARLGVDHGGRPARARRRQDRQGHARSASWSPSGPRRPASRPSSSTAAATVPRPGRRDRRRRPRGRAVPVSRTSTQLT